MKKTLLLILSMVFYLGMQAAVTFSYTVDPKEGETTSLSSIAISYEDGVQLNAKESAWGNAKLYNESNEPVAEVMLATPIGTYGQTYTGYQFTLGEDGSGMTISDIGEYYFVIPEGYISFYDSANKTWVECDEISVHYVVVGEGETSRPQDLTYEVNPAEGKVPSLSKITFLREAGIINQVGETGQMTLSKLYLENESGRSVAFVSGVSDDADENWSLYSTSITYELTSEISTEGTYYFIVPAGAFAMYDNGNYFDCEDIKLTYYVTGISDDHEYSIDPEEGVQSSLKNFTFTSYDGICGNDEGYAEYNGTVSIYKDGSTEPYATTTNIEGDWDSNVSFDYDVYLYINFENEITEAGEYELVIPAGLFNWYDDDKPTLNEEIRFSYTVDGSLDTGGSGHGYSADDPFEVSEVIALAETLSSSDTVEGVYVKGIVSQIGSFYSNYGDLDYYISDDGTTDNQFYIYNGYYLDGEKFTSADQIKVTDTVIVTGDLTNYQGNTPELARGSKIVYLEEGEGVEGGSDGSVSASGSTVTLTNNGVTVGTETATIDFTTLGLSDAEDVSGRAFELSDGSTVTFAQNGGATSPKYYDVSTAIRAYALNTATFAASKQIAKIEMTCASSSYTGNTTATVEFSETGAVYCNDHTQNSGGTQLRVQSLVVYYAEEGDESIWGVPEGYVLDPANESDVETLSTIKISLESGSLTLNSYDAQGVVMSKTGGQVATVSFTDDYDDELQVGYCIATLSEDISEMDTYYVTFPAGVFFDFGTSESNPEFTATYYVTGPTSTTEYTFDPEEGEVSSLHSISISYDDGIKLNAKESQWGNIKVYDESGNEVVEVIYASPIIGEGYYTEANYIGYTFSLGKDLSSQDVTAAGEYDFVIPAGYISFYDAETSQYVETTEDITAHYIVVSSGDQPQDLTYDVDPAEGEVTSLSKITFLREAGIVNQVGEEGQMALSNLYVCDANYNPVAYVGGVSEDADDNWKLYSISVTYELTNDVVDEGIYHFIVPAGAFAMYDNGDYIDCEDIDLIYYVTGGAEAAGLVFDPESNTTHESLSGFTVSYTGDGGMSVTTMPNDGASVYLEGGDGEEYTYATYEEIYDDDSGLCVAVEFTFATPLTEDGTYDVVIPAELLYYGYGGMNDEEIILVYTISTTTGIGGISINDENVEGIYSISGQKLNSTQKGVNIVRYNDGTVKKIYIK